MQIANTLPGVFLIFMNLVQLALIRPLLLVLLVRPLREYPESLVFLLPWYLHDLSLLHLANQCPESFDFKPSTQIGGQQIELVLRNVPYGIWNDSTRDVVPALVRLEIYLTSYNKPDIKLKVTEDLFSTSLTKVISQFEKGTEYNVKVKYVYLNEVAKLCVCKYTHYVETSRLFTKHKKVEII